MKDMLGRPLSYGDRVAYAALSYRRAHLRVGTVVPHKDAAVERWKDLYVRVKGDAGYPGGLKQPEQLLLVEAGAGEFVA